MKRVARSLACLIVGSSLAGLGCGTELSQIEEGGGNPPEAIEAISRPLTSRSEPVRVWIKHQRAGKANVKAALNSAGATTHYEFDDLETVVATLPAAAVAALEQNPNVDLIEEDAQRFPLAQQVPYGIDMVQARDVWDADRDGVVDPGAATGAGRKVCIIDSGFALGHEDLPAANVSGYAGNLPWNQDGCGHGSHVAGTIAAVHNGAGVVGVSPGTVSLYIVRVFGNNCAWAYSSDLVNAANKCRDAGANVISMSLGGSAWVFNEYLAFQNLWSQGIASVAAAGNAGSTAYSYPASYPAVISVAAVDQNKVLASFSQRNDEVDFAAPGVAVLSTYPTSPFYKAMSGTSMATPHVSGVAALVWSGNAAWTNAQVRFGLKMSALDLGAAGRDNSYGSGLVQSKGAIDFLNGVATFDTTAPVIAEVASRKIDTRGGFEITWTTAEPSDSVVTLTCCGTFRNNALTTSHRMTFSGIKKRTYSYYAGSTDAAENRAHAGTFQHLN